MDYLKINDVSARTRIKTENNPFIKDYKYKVHSAIYSWGESREKLKATHDVTKVAQQILDDTTKEGIIPVNNTSFRDPAPLYWKSFAIVVSIVDPNDNEVTRFCTCRDGTALDVKSSGVICYF